MIRIRQKISFGCLMQSKSIKECFLTQILKTYNHMDHQFSLGVDQILSLVENYNVKSFEETLFVLKNILKMTKGSKLGANNLIKQLTQSNHI